MREKLALLFFIIMMIGFFFPVSSFADGSYSVCTDNDCNNPRINVQYEGLVPCGKCVTPSNPLERPSDFSEEEWDRFMVRAGEQCGVDIPASSLERFYISCQLCHGFVMINNAISYFLIYIIPPLAILMIIIGGIMFYAGGMSPKQIERGKAIIKTVLIGIALIYGAYLIVGTFLNIIGVTEYSGLSSWADQGVFAVDCPIIVQ